MNTTQRPCMQSSGVDVALGLGSSMGPRRATLERTIRQLDAHPDLELLAVSRWYRTPPMRGGTARGWFLNGVARFRTRLSPDTLLDLCRELERQSGRRRARFWGDRPLDLDILLYGTSVVTTATLTLPHPGIGKRSFVYWPLLEVWPDAEDPVTQHPWVDAKNQPVPRKDPVGVFARRRPLAYLTGHP